MGGCPELSPLDSESSFCSLLTLHSMTKKAFESSNNDVIEIQRGISVLKSICF